MQYENFNIFYDKKGYPIIWLDGKNIKLHVYIWEKNFGSKPKGYDVHHKDFNKKNYNLNNLELLLSSDHKKIHAGWIKNEKGELELKYCKTCGELLHIDSFYKRKGMTPSNVCIECTKKYYKILNKDSKYKEKRKEYMKKYYEENKKEKWGVK